MDDLDIPEFLLVKNRVPLTPEKKAAYAEVLRNSKPYREHDARAQTQLDYKLAIAHEKALKAAIAAPAREAFFAKKKAEAAEIKAVKETARITHAARRRKRSY